MKIIITNNNYNLWEIFKMKRLHKVLFCSMVAVFVSACGGGGDGNSPASSDSVSGADVSGTVSKGIVKDGVVVAEELNSSGAVIAVVGNAITTADGSYSLTLSNDYNGGPIQITVSANVDTQMKCDVPTGCGTRTDGLADTDTIIDFGEWYKPASLTMTALVAGAEANAKVGVSVTPFTHMAAVRAKAATIFDSASVARANSEVSNLLGGIDILNTAPIDITSFAAIFSDATSKKQITYAALASAIANQGLTDANGQPDLNAAINLLAASFTGGIILADDSVGDDAAQISLQEIVDSALDTFRVIPVADVTGVLFDLLSDIVIAASGDGIIDPQPSTTVADPNLDKVKAMMSDVRTWGNVILAETQGKSAAFQTQINLASNAGSIVLGDARSSALDASVRAATRFNGETDLSTYNLGTINSFSSGTITSAVPGEITIKDGVNYGHTINMTVTLPDDGTTASTFKFAIISATVNHPNADLTINSGMVNVTFVSEYTIDYAAREQGTAVLLPNVAAGTFDLDVQFIRKVDDTTGNVLDSPVTFAGSLVFDVTAIPVVNNPLANLVLPSTFELTGSVSNTVGDSTDISLVANVTNTDSFQFVGDFAPVGTSYSSIHSWPLVSWTYTNTDAVSGDDTFRLNYPDYSVYVFWNATDNSITRTVTYWDSFPFWGSTQTFSGFDSLSAFLTSNPEVSQSYGINAYVDGEGLYFASTVGVDFSVAGTLDGMLIDPEFIINNPDNWLDADIGFTFTVQLSGLPEARINITGDRTGFRAGNATTTISYGTRWIDFSVSFDKFATPRTTGALTIKNQDGVVLTIDFTKEKSDFFDVNSGLATGTLSYNEIVYADVAETRRGYVKVTYIDGTFEIY